MDIHLDGRLQSICLTWQQPAQPLLLAKVPGAGLWHVWKEWFLTSCTLRLVGSDHEGNILCAMI
jgi:hypothetical protein